MWTTEEEESDGSDSESDTDSASETDTDDVEDDGITNFYIEVWSDQWMIKIGLRKKQDNAEEKNASRLHSKIR